MLKVWDNTTFLLATFRISKTGLLGSHTQLTHMGIFTTTMVLLLQVNEIIVALKTLPQFKLWAPLRHRLNQTVPLELKVAQLVLLLRKRRNGPMIVPIAAILKAFILLQVQGVIPQKSLRTSLSLPMMLVAGVKIS